MKKIFLVLLSMPQLLFANTSFSSTSCYEKLTIAENTKNFKIDATSGQYNSRSFFLYTDYDSLSEKDFASKAVMELLTKLKCEVKKLNLQNPVNCLKNAHNSICQLDSDSGYFVIIRDYLEGTHIVFNRFD